MSSTRRGSPVTGSRVRAQRPRHPPPVRPGKAKNLLGYEPKKHFKEGVAETALWYREHGYL